MSETKKLKLLFLCTGNSCRSQMAEGWTRHLKDDLIEPYSAGTNPKGVDPRAIKVMQEAGIDISDGRSKHVDELKFIPFDYVITVCGHANEACPTFSGTTKRIHIGFDDPPKLAEGVTEEQQALFHYRRVRNEIKAFVEELPDSLKQRVKQ